MLTAESNKLFTEIDEGTPMGDLLRRYWMPVAAVSEFDERATKPVRLMGEDLVLYKDLSGNYGLTDRHCAHRRADLSYGFVEETGIRCNYHGWCYDQNGNCIEQPYEDTVDPSGKLRKQVKLKAYPVEEKAGLLWAYMGPEPVPLVPTWEPFTWENGFVQIVLSEIPCNWFQCQENSIDPVHFEWMHANWSIRLKGETGPYSPKHTKVDFDEFDYGFRYLRVREDTDEEHPLWTVGRACLWPNCLFTGEHFEWRVPIDDENTLSVGWFFARVPTDREPYVQERIPFWESPIKDEETGRWISTHVMNQDFIAWVGQGTVADRTKEHLGLSDKGVGMIRKRYMDDIERIKKGEDPKAIVRNPNENGCIELPIIGRKYFKEGLSSEEIREHADSPIGGTYRRFPFLAKQPQWVKDEFEEATGFRLQDSFPQNQGELTNIGSKDEEFVEK